MASRHVGVKLRRRHCYTAHGSDHPCHILLPEVFPLPRHLLLIFQLTPLPPYEPGGTHHRLGFSQGDFWGIVLCMIIPIRVWIHISCLYVTTCLFLNDKGDFYDIMKIIL